MRPLAPRMNLKKIILSSIAAIILLVLVGVGVALLRSDNKENGSSSFFGNLPFIGGRDGGPEPSLTPAEPPPTDTPPPTADGRPLIQIIDREILAPTITNEGDAIRYVARENGHVFQTDLAGGNERALVKITIAEPYEGFWAPLRNRVALFSVDAGVPKKFLAGVATGTASRFLPPEITSLDWSPDGASLAYLQRRKSDTTLVIADAAGQKPATVYTTPVPDFTLKWVAKNTILLASRPSGLAPGLVMRFSVSSRAAEVLLANRNGIIVQPLADGSGFLFSESNARGEAEPLSFFNLAPAAITPLNVTTLADKCSAVAIRKKVYCGVPQGTILGPSPDQWYQGAVSLRDSIMEIDLANGAARGLLGNDADVDVLAIFPTPDGRYLFFHDKKTGTLWRFDLRAPPSSTPSPSPAR